VRTMTIIETKEARANQRKRGADTVRRVADIPVLYGIALFVEFAL
jgi:hypothetical protein